MVLAAAGTLQAQPDPGVSVFTIHEGGQPVGTFISRVEPTGDGWTISGRVDSPGRASLQAPYLDISYDAAWRARSVTVERLVEGRPWVSNTGFQGGVARTNVSTPELVVDDTWLPVDQAALVLPDGVFPAYEALAARLETLGVGDLLEAFAPPATSGPLRVDEVEHTAAGSTGWTGDPGPTARARLTWLLPEPVVIEIWVRGGRLAELHLPQRQLRMRRDALP
jgi:hypothetical protein